MKRLKRGLVAVFLLLLVLVCAVSLYRSKYGLQLTHYTVETAKLTAPVRIVQVTDLHNSRFGPDNAELVQLVRQQNPDLILVTGDLLNQSQPETGVAVTLVQQLCSVAPVWFSYGNHEKAHEQQFGSDMTALLTAAGATVLDEDYRDITVNGQALRLGGIYGYCLPAQYLSTGEAKQNECDYLNAFQSTDRCTVLLCHMPVCWIINGSLDAWSVDVVFAGHAHGGQIRLPLIGGLWAPDQGWFPGRECGVYYSADQSRAMVLSRGLGTDGMIPRFNNLPELVVTDLLPLSQG